MKKTLFLSEEFTEEAISESILDEATGKKKWYVEGMFMSVEKKNRNGRMYSESVGDKAMGIYQEEYMDASRSIGELNHPDYLEPNMKFASHKFEKVWKKGKDWYGRALILEGGHGDGNQIITLIKAGVAMGFSTRGSGSATVKKGTKHINEDFRVTTADIVFSPSGIGCEKTKPLHESFINENGEVYREKEEIDSANAEKDLIETHLKDDAISFIKKLKYKK